MRTGVTAALLACLGSAVNCSAFSADTDGADELVEQLRQRDDVTRVTYRTTGGGTQGFKIELEVTTKADLPAAEIAEVLDVITEVDLDGNTQVRPSLVREDAPSVTLGGEIRDSTTAAESLIAAIDSD